MPQSFTSSLLLAALLGSCTVGCERELSDQPQPLRPLVYTEANPEEDVSNDVVALMPRFTIPEDLGLAVFQGLVEHDRELFEESFVTGPELVALVRTSADRSQEMASELLATSESVWSLFLPSEPSEEPVGGLTSRLRVVEFKVGKGRDIAGKVGKPGKDDVVQHWGNELRLELRDSKKIFTLRVPKIVKTKNGWKVAQALEVDPTLRTYLESGMHLKPELLTSQHYPFPLEVGNFWKYRVEYVGGRRPIDPAKEDAEEAPAPAPDKTPTAATLSGAAVPDANPTPVDVPARVENPTITIKVTDIARRDGFLIATFAKEVQDGEITTETFRQLVTTRRIFPCTRDCIQNIDDIAYLLGYMSQQTPVFVFPLVPGASWGVAGRSGEHDRYEVKPELQSDASVPAGDFSDAIVIGGSIGEGHEERLFVPGTGVVLRKVRSGLGPRTEVMVEYRLLL